MKLSIEKIQHVGIPVTDLKKSEAFYQKLGFENVMSSTFEFDGGTGKVAMMKQREVIIEIYQMPNHLLNDIRNRKDGHIDHVAFDVKNIDEVFQMLKENGFEVLEEKPVQLAFWKNGCKYFNIKGPDGERLEFNEIL